MLTDLFRRRHYFVFLLVGTVAVELKPWEIINMATTINAGQTLPMTIAYLDQNGHPMATTPTPDAAPQWTQSTPATDTLTVAADGNSATALGLPEGGTDVITLDLTVGGQAFSATLDLTVTAAAQVLTSIAIVPGTAT